MIPIVRLAKKCLGFFFAKGNFKGTVGTSVRMPTLHLQVCAGFANRVRAMVSGICLAETLNMPLVVHWFPKSPECACRFSSVLDPESLPKTVKIVPEDIYQAYDVQTLDDWNRVNFNWDKKSDLFMKSHGIFFLS